MGLEVRAWLAPHPHPQAQLLVLSDALQYLTEAPILPRLREPGRPNTHALLFAPTDPSRCAEVLGAGERLDRFLEEELLHWAWRIDPYVGHTPRRIIAGASLGGLAAAGVVRRRAQTFDYAIVQSAALWWPDNSFAELSAWEAGDLPHVRVFHEVGQLEGHLRAENRRFAAAMTRGLGEGAAISREYVGGHDYVCWRAGILDALDWFARA